MPSTTLIRPVALVVTTVAAGLLVPGPAAAGEFPINACQADRGRLSTQAFADFASRGMGIKRACDPQGPGLRGLITTNAVRRADLPRGAQASLSLSAPPGTRLTRFRWSGAAHRSDCRYTLEVYADRPRGPSIPIRQIPANRACSRGPGQASGWSTPRTYNVAGATRIVQRVVCVSSRGRGGCSARQRNYIRTFTASATVADISPPAIRVAGGALGSGSWVSGTQTLFYTAADNVGVRLARAVIAGRDAGVQQRLCDYARPIPCPNGPGQIVVNTMKTLPEGTSTLVLQAQDSAGNRKNSVPVTARIDNTPPARIDASVAGGQGWRNSNSFALAWVNPPERDRAPIAAANYKLCPAGGGTCRRGVAAGANLARLALSVPAPGAWNLSLWRRDAAGNQEEDNASVPVSLRYDPEPPRLGFEQAPLSDPTRVSVLVTDRVSGLAGGQIEISRQGSGIWQVLPTSKEGNRLVAHIDDSRLPAGAYQLRSRAFDGARNESSSDRLLDGRPMVLNLPLRIATSLSAGVATTRTVRRRIRKRGKRRTVRRRVTVLKRAARVRRGRRVRIAGKLVNPDGQGIASAPVYVFSRTPTSAERLVSVVQTDRAGRYRYTATASSSRTLRLVYGGAPLILAAAQQVTLLVPATSSIRMSRRRALNGEAVTFRGRLRGLPAPPGGKLVELQVRLSGGWQTFRTTHTDATGRWRRRYRFKRVRGIQHFWFRARLPREAGYPFESGRSRALRVRVRGR